VGRIGINTNDPQVTFEVNGAAANTSSEVGDSGVVDFTKSNLGEITSGGIVSATGTKDGGTYTLAYTVTGGTSIPAITVTGFIVKMPDGAPSVKTATQTIVYTIVCINTNAYVYPTLFN
jgi:hypothetical protein